MFGACLKCPAAVAAWQLSPAARTAVPESALLCLDHLRELVRLRERAAQQAARQAARRWCPCGRELYLDHATCSWCQLGQPRATPVQAGGDLSLRLTESSYRADSCKEADCAAKLVWRLPDGRIVCGKHGAAVNERFTA